MRSGIFLGLATCAAMLAGAALAGPGSITPHFVEGACKLPAKGVEMRCGQVIAPERRDGKSARAIALEVQILPASRTPRQADPIIFLGGGPGEILTDKAALIAQASGIRDRDIILLDQRGLGLSRPALVCPEVDRDDRLDGFVPDAERERWLKACAGSYAGQADLSAYSTAENARDVVDVIRALGYRSWNIIGVSYGTRLGLSVMRLKPEGLRAVVLDSPYPPEINGFDDKPALFFDQLDKLLADCAAEPACKAAYPDLRARLVARLEALIHKPALAEVSSRQGDRGGQARITTRLVMGDLRRAMYSHDALPRIPSALDALAKGDYATFFDRLDGPRHPGHDDRVPGGFAAGMQLSIQCQDEQGWGGKRRAPAGDWPKAVFDAFQYPYDRSDCATWSVAAAPSALHDRVKSDIPALILAGDLDPVTPPSLGQSALKGLTNGRLIALHGLGHSVTTTACGQMLIAQFIADPRAPIDQACVARQRAEFQFKVAAGR